MVRSRSQVNETLEAKQAVIAADMRNCSGKPQRPYLRQTKMREEKKEENTSPRPFCDCGRVHPHDAPVRSRRKEITEASRRLECRYAKSPPACNSRHKDRRTGGRTVDEFAFGLLQWERRRGTSHIRSLCLVLGIKRTSYFSTQSGEVIKNSSG